MSCTICIARFGAELKILECCFLICFYNLVQLTGHFQPFDFIFFSYSIREAEFSGSENTLWPVKGVSN